MTSDLHFSNTLRITYLSVFGWITVSESRRDDNQESFVLD